MRRLRNRVVDWILMAALRWGLKPLTVERTAKCPACGYACKSKTRILFARTKGR